MNVVAVVQGLDAQRAALSAYVLRTLLDTLGVPHEVVHDAGDVSHAAPLLWYGTAPPPPDAPAAVQIACLPPPDADTPIAWAQPCGGSQRLAFLGGHRPVAGAPVHVAAATGEPIVATEGTHWRIGFDLVASAAFWLTGGDETPDRFDAFGRMRGVASPRHEASLTATPVVTQLMQLLRQGIEWAAAAMASPLVRLAPWPAGHTHALLLSHDIDLWRKRTPRQLAKELLRCLTAPRRAGSVLKAFLAGPDPWALEPIADLEAQHGARSTFFLLPGRPDRRADGRRIVNGYPVNRETVAATARRLVQRGWEVALHGSFAAERSTESVAAERRDVERLAGHPVTGVRQHFLHFERPATWRRQVGAGLTYDATLGYRDTDGHRAGFSFPFRPFADGEELPLLELPLVVMDGALLAERRLDADDAWACIQAHLQRTARDESMLTVLWHNTHFCDLDAPGYRGAYERLLESAREAWTPTMGELADWWRRRSAAALSVEQSGSRTTMRVTSSENVADLLLEVRAPGSGAAPPRVQCEGCSAQVTRAAEGAATVQLDELSGGTGTIIIEWM